MFEANLSKYKKKSKNIILKVENISKQYRLGTVGTGTGTITTCIHSSSNNSKSETTFQLSNKKIMTFTKTNIEDVLIFEPKKFEDERGYLTRRSKKRITGCGALGRHAMNSRWKDDLDSLDLCVERVKDIFKQVMCERTAHFHFLKRDRDRFRFVRPHPDGEVTI